MPARKLIRLDAQTLVDNVPHEVGREETVVATKREPCRHVRPCVERPGLGKRRLSLTGSGLLNASAKTSAGTSWKNSVTTSTSSPTSRPSRSASSRRAPAQPVFANHSPGDSPRLGTIAVTRTTSRTGTRSQTSGATKPASDCATRTTSRRLPVAATTVAAYSHSPAESSSVGRSGTTTSCARLLNSGATRCQYHESDPEA
jgi:hypothetical protein